MDLTRYLAWQAVGAARNGRKATVRGVRDTFCAWRHGWWRGHSLGTRLRWRFSPRIIRLSWSARESTSRLRDMHGGVV